MGTHLMYICCLRQMVYSFVSLLVVNESEEGVVAFKNPLQVGTGADMRTQYLLTHWPMI